MRRQPICDQSLNIVGYELLAQTPPAELDRVSEGSCATAKVVVDALFEMGADHIVGAHPAFINIPREFLIGTHCDVLPKERVVLEILEDVAPDAEVVSSIRRLTEAGYVLALDDFVFEESKLPLVELAQIIKLDVRDLGRNKVAQTIHRLQNHKLTFLAEKVEDYADFEFYSSLGIEWFQGFFFCRPKLLHGRRGSRNNLASMRLWSALQNPEADVRSLSAIISQDLNLCYRLLRYVNSASFGVKRNVDSVIHAVSLLGSRKIRQIAGLMALVGMEDQPAELLTTAVIRARACESIAVARGQANSDVYFAAGLLSVLDAFLNLPMSEAVSLLPLSPVICDALLKGTGPIGEVLKSIRAYEEGTLDAASEAKLDSALISNSYLNAILWSNQIMADCKLG